MMRQRIFGENKIQEMEVNGTDAQRYSVAHDWSCQTNKVKFMAPFVNLIHGVDSFKLKRSINRL
jgi:uncharacterized pyridoxal phosphate-containing UPF0001 family protein